MRISLASQILHWLLPRIITSRVKARCSSKESCLRLPTYTFLSSCYTHHFAHFLFLVIFRCVLTPGDPYMPLPNDEIIRRVSKQVIVIVVIIIPCVFFRLKSLILIWMVCWSQVLALFPSSQGVEVTWSSVVKIGQSLYREGPGKDPFRPDQKTPVKNFFLAGSYTKQVKSCLQSHEGMYL